MNAINYRLQAEKFQVAGLLMLTGFVSVVFPLSKIVASFGPAGAVSSDLGEVETWLIIGHIFLLMIGLSAFLIGFLHNVHDFRSKNLTTVLILVVHTAFIPWISDMVCFGKLAQVPPTENKFIPLSYSPSVGDVKFVGAMSVLGILFYGFAYVGSIGFFAETLHLYNCGKHQTIDGKYYQSKLGLYGFVLFFAGLTQLLLGVYCRFSFGLDLLEEGPVQAAVFVVTFPALSVFVGLFQVITGAWSVLRAKYHHGSQDFGFQIFMAIQFLLVLTVQYITQIGYLPGGELSAAAPTYASMSLGLTLMPAFLDQKMRTTPFELPSDHYKHSPQEDDGSVYSWERSIGPLKTQEDECNKRTMIPLTTLASDDSAVDSQLAEKEIEV